MKKKRKNIIKIAMIRLLLLERTVSKALSKHYNLFYLDTEKFIVIAFLKINYPEKFNLSLSKKKSKFKD